MESSFINLLLASATVTAVVSTRVYPVDVPQGAELPALTVTRVSGGPLYAADGETGLDNGRIQVDCWADTYTAAKDLATFVRVALTGPSSFLLIELIDERDIRDDIADGAEYPYHMIQDYNVWKGA